MLPKPPPLMTDELVMEIGEKALRDPIDLLSLKRKFPF
jgi:hypothetical protein